jgi:hypothetical protein
MYHELGPKKPLRRRAAAYCSNSCSQHVGVQRQIGRAAGGAEPAAALADRRQWRGLPDALGPALAKARAHHGAHVGLELAHGGVEVLLVVQHVVPLPDRVLRFRVDVARDVGAHVLWAEAVGEVRHAQVGDRDAAVGVMAGEAPYHRRAPVVADPHRLVVAQRREQLEHVGHRVLERVVFVPRVDARTAVAAHVGRHRMKAQAREARQLMAPAQRQLGPAVHEDDRRRSRGTARQVGRLVALCLHRVLAHWKSHGHASLRGEYRGNGAARLSRR